MAAAAAAAGGAAERSGARGTSDGGSDEDGVPAGEGTYDDDDDEDDEDELVVSTPEELEATLQTGLGVLFSWCVDSEVAQAACSGATKLCVEVCGDTDTAELVAAHADTSASAQSAGGYRGGIVAARITRRMAFQLLATLASHESCSSVSLRLGALLALRSVVAHTALLFDSQLSLRTAEALLAYAGSEDGL